jgi:UDP-glucose 4-epimerase
VFNVACGGSFTLLELLASLNELLGMNVEPIHEKPRVGDVRESLADIYQARKMLDYEPQVSFHEGLSRSVDYYKQLAADG